MPQIAKIFNGNLDQALDICKDHLYVRNAEKERRLLLIDIKDSYDKTRTLKFPKTWVPIDILTFIDRDSARKSPTLRTYFRKGLLQLLDSTSAHAIATSEEGIAEARRAGLSNGISSDVNKTSEPTGTASSNQDENYFSNMYIEISECSTDEEALNKVKNISSVFYSDPDEYISNESSMLALNNMRDFFNKKGFTKSLAEVKGILSYAEDNK